MFRKHQRRSNGKRTQQSLAQAEADHRQQARKLEQERPVKEKLDELIAGNDLAYRLALSLGIYQQRRQ